MMGSDFVKELSERTGMSYSDAYRIVKIYHEIVIDSLLLKEKISFIGFGTYDLVYRQGRSIKSPFAGESVEIKAGYKAVFRFSRVVNRKFLNAAPPKDMRQSNTKNS